jgi:phosphate transport system substrate-binding protein
VTKSLKLSLAALALAAGFAATAQAGDITGAGATFVYPALSKWSADYNKATGNQVNYQSIGQFPSVVGGVVPIVNLPGIAPGKIRFTGPILADIFLGKIAKWNDPALVAINPGVKLPDSRITVVHRSDGSGTTFNWVNYLSKVSPEWKTKVGEGTSVKWPAGVGGKGNEGVAAYTKQIKGAIGYVELSYALVNKLVYGSVKNKSGKFIAPSIASFQAAAASADWANSKDFYLVMTDAPGADAYPIAATNFIIMYKKPKDKARARQAVDFFKWVYANGDAAATSLGYVPLPPALVKQIDAYWATNFKF